MAGKKRTSIKAEITFFIILLMVIVTGSLGYFILEAQKQSLTTEVKLRGLSIAKNMANNMADFILTDDELSVMRIITDTMNNTGVVYAFFVDEKNVIKAHNKIEMFGTAFSEPEAREIIETEPYAISVYGGKGGRIIDFSAPVVAKGRLTLGSVRLGISHSLIDNVINAAYVKAAIIALIALVLGIAGAFFLGAAITRPIGTLAQGAKIIGTGNLAHTIKINSNNELGELASVFNAMTGDLKKAQEAAIQQQRLERELELARDIQLSLIPKDIEKIKGYEVAAYYLAAKEVGGDYYDVMRLNDDKFGFVVGDVSGKGVPAALVMTMARSVLHADARGLFDKPSSETLKRLNSTVSKDIKDGMFITLFYGILDIKKNVLNISSAGHNDTVVYRKKSGEIIPYNPKGFPIGTDPGPRFDKVIKSEDILLEKGDAVVLFTDGITEAMNAANEEYGDERLVEAVKLSAGKTAKDVVDAVVGSVNGFAGGAEQSDDIALVVIKRDE